MFPRVQTLFLAALVGLILAGSSGHAASDATHVDEVAVIEEMPRDRASNLIAPPGFRGTFDFFCYGVPGGLGRGTWTISFHSETLHKRYPATITCASNVNGGNPSGVWPHIPLAAGPLTFTSQVLTSTVIGGVLYEAPAVHVGGNAFASGEALANVDTGRGAVTYALAVPQRLN